MTTGTAALSAESLGPLRGLFLPASNIYLSLSMDFPLPFNDRIRIRLFEPVAVQDSPCHRVVDVLGVSFAHDGFSTVDSITAGYASQFHHPQHGWNQKSVAEIKKTVDDTVDRLNEETSEEDSVD